MWFLPSDWWFSQPDYWPRTYLLVGGVSFALSVLLMPVAIVLLRRIGMVDALAPNKIHLRPTPRGGGLVIFFAFAVAVLLPGYRSDGMNGILLGAAICAGVGALDDFVGGIAGFWKLLTLLAATLLLSWFDVRLNLFQNDVLDITFTLLWIVGVTSAFNGIDNMDGLASGVGIIVATMFFVIAMQAYFLAGTETSLSWFGMLAVGLIGANLGFLLFNFKPARIFMGDSGSFFLGFTLAALGVMGEWNEHRMLAAVIPILILGVPLFDFAYIIISRIWRGETRTIRQVIDHCAPDHLSHRLTWIGFSQRQAVLFIYLLAGALGISGILLRNSDSLIDAELALLQGLAIIAIVIILMASAARGHQQARDARDAHARARAGGKPAPRPAWDTSPARQRDDDKWPGKEL